MSDKIPKNLTARQRFDLAMREDDLIRFGTPTFQQEEKRELGLSPTDLTPSDEIYLHRKYGGDLE